MSSIIVACATDDHKTFPQKHFGDCLYYDLYAVDKGKFLFLKTVDNPSSLETESLLHSVAKPNSIAKTLFMDDVNILVCRRMGINVKKMRIKFDIVISRYEEIEQTLVKISLLLQKKRMILSNNKKFLTILKRSEDDFMAKTTVFDKFYNEYNNWFDRNSDIYQAEVLAVKSILPSKGTGIEIGVGSGKFAQPLGIQNGVEPSKKMAQLARDIGINVLDGRAEELPVEDLSYDYALMVTAICFVDDACKTFSELYRILKPNGELLMAYVDKNSYLGQKYQKNKDKSIFYREATFFDSKELIELGEKAGFVFTGSCQTLFSIDNKIDTTKISNGHDEGAFVVLKFLKEQ